MEKIGGTKRAGVRSMAKSAMQIAALAGVSSLALSGAAWAQQMAQASDLSGVDVEARKEAPIGRLPQPIEEQPQTVHVIDEEMLRAQATTTLDRAVRNVPGITANTGEGGGAVAGDQFRIRGFDAQNDLATDGLRDFGVYTRDTFNIESVQVFLGPSGTTFGRGSFGGAINTTSKFAREDVEFTTVQGSVGTADLGRVILDTNQHLSETSAFRLNLMAHHNAVDDIDQVESDRFGAAGAIGWGLGTDTSFQLMYFHQSDDRVPYYGVPVAAAPGTAIARPLPVDHSVFYGTNRDLDETDADVVTAKFAHKFSETLSVSNDTRVGFFARDFMAVAPSCPTACVTNFFDNDPATVPLVTRGGASGPYSLDQWGVQNITTLIADNNLGAFRNQLVTGIDLMYESSDRLNRSAYQPGGATFPRPAANAFDPDPYWDNPAFIATNERRSNSTSAAFFVSDQLWFTDEFSILAGIRYERYRVNSDQQTWGTVDSASGAFTSAPAFSSLEQEDTLVSPRFSLIWEPGENTLLYASWARSEQPPTGTAIASVGTPVSATFQSLDPTTSETYEIGGRFPLFNPALIASVAVFRTERSNATAPNEFGVAIGSGDEQRATGVEIGLDGQITDRWAIQASYTHLDTETLRGVNTSGVTLPETLGKQIPFAAEHAATLWTTFDVTDALQIGGGVTYTDEVWLNNTNTSQAPEYLSFDALISYELGDGMTLQLNGANLADREDNYDQVTSSRAARSAGRAFIASLTKTF